MTHGNLLNLSGPAPLIAQRGDTPCSHRAPLGFDLSALEIWGTSSTAVGSSSRRPGGRTPPSSAA